MRRIIDIPAILALGVASFGFASYAQAQQTDVYSTKFLCGEFHGVPGALEGPVKPGNYLTAINVHNPNGGNVFLRKKAVLLFRADQQPPPPPETSMPPGPLITLGLHPDFGFEIDCNDIRQVLLGGSVPPNVFIKGFVVIEVSAQGPQHGTPPPPIDVVPVYTSHGFDADAMGFHPRGFSLDVERVSPVRRVF